MKRTIFVMNRSFCKACATLLISDFRQPMLLRRFFIFCFLSALATYGMAQVPERSIHSVELFRTRADTISADALLKSKNQDLFKAASMYGRSSAHDIFWIKLGLTEIAEDLEAHQEWAAYFGVVDKATLYYQQGNQLRSREFGGLNTSDPNSVFDRHVLFSSDELIDGKYLLVKYRKLTSTRNMGSFTASVLPLERLKTEQPRRDFLRLKNRTFTYIFIGIGGIVLLFAISAFITQKRNEYLFYSFYLIFLLLYFGRRAFAVHGFIIGGSPVLDYTMHMELQVLINLSYVLFARNFLFTKRDYPVLDRWIKVVATALALFIITDIIMIQAEQFSIHFTMMNVQRYFMASFGLLGSIYLLIKRKSVLVYFIVFGSLSYTSGALLTLFLVENDYMIAGSAIEIFIFTLGLTYKSLGLLRKNARIKQEVLQLEMKALRAQMNPHFIFNSLGSIQYLIRMDRQKKALQYLSNFSRLLRLVLDSSRQGSISVAEEAELLEIYIGLEALRFEHRFTYEVVIDPNLDAHNQEIPILLVQPHVENAIIHGLLPKKADSHLEVGFYDEPEYIRCMVIDNGIGRKASAEAKAARNPGHQSHGQSIVSDRLRQMADKNTNPDLIQIVDIETGLSERSGTKVTIRIPKED